ncbi:hypothetical protein [Enterococcus faecium]
MLISSNKPFLKVAGVKVQAMPSYLNDSWDKSPSDAKLSKR